MLRDGGLGATTAPLAEPSPSPGLEVLGGHSGCLAFWIVWVVQAANLTLVTPATCVCKGSRGRKAAGVLLAKNWSPVPVSVG